MLGEMGRGPNTQECERQFRASRQWGGSDNAFNIQVGMERPAEMVPRPPGEVLKENKVARTHLRRADFEHWGLSEGCPGCRCLRIGQERQQAHSEGCWRRIEGLLNGEVVCIRTTGCG